MTASRGAGSLNIAALFLSIFELNIIPAGLFA